MKKATNRILSFLTAFAMVIGVLVAPFTSANAAESTDKNAKTNTVTLHKILQSKENLNAKDEDKKDVFPGQKGLDDTEYDGNEIKSIGSYFGKDAKDIGGVYFAWAKQDTDGQYYWADENGKIIGEKTEDKDTGEVKDTRVKAEKGKYEKMPENTYGGLTVENKGFEFQTSSFSGTYKIFEIESESTYLGGENKDSTLTGSKAVPVEITLPLVNNKGTIPAAHVYPKNTEDKPTTNKDFYDQFTDTQNGRDENVDEKTVQENPETSEKEKKDAWEPKNVGDKVDYKVVTTIPANSRYATAYWNDEMTDGLTLDITSVKLEYTGNKDVTLAKDTDYTVKPTSNDGKQGFELEFTEAGLGKINGKDNEGTITITYSAKVNENAVVAIPESNDVNFFYGNNPRKGNTPKPNYPDDNGKLKVTKTWYDKKWAEGEKATFRLVDAQTGKTVTAEDLVQGDASDEDFEAYKKAFKSEQEIGYNVNGGEAEWKYLDKNKQYKAVEINMTAGTESEYKVNDKGEIIVVDHKTNNPAPINPTEPKVVTYGARFVKTNADGSERLDGAEFVVKKKGSEEYLTGTEADRTAYNDAQAAYEAAIKAYNALEADKQTDKELAKVKEAEKARDNAWNATLKDMTQWTGTSKDDTANIKLTSNAEGQFEIAGLAPGTYTLVEIKAPKDYVDAKKATLEFEFEVTKDGNKTKDIKFDAKDDNAKDNAQQIINKKVTIPQTGGIGSLIFIVAGLAIMGVAFVAMKKKNAIEA